jgi:hypothetical protein
MWHGVSRVTRICALCSDAIVMVVAHCWIRSVHVECSFYASYYDVPQCMFLIN